MCRLDIRARSQEYHHPITASGGVDLSAAIVLGWWWAATQETGTCSASVTLDGYIDLRQSPFLPGSQIESWCIYGRRWSDLPIQAIPVIGVCGAPSSFYLNVVRHKGAWRLFAASGSHIPDFDPGRFNPRTRRTTWMRHAPNKLPKTPQSPDVN